MDAIDVVLLWVDGNDPLWLDEKGKYLDHPGEKKQSRFRDWDFLKYIFRSIEYNAPWIRKIHFVTWGHLPKWLNVNHPKLNIVKHSDFIPQKYLPTFNANTIELNIHRIKDLSEKFLYFNDDMFVFSPMKECDFFINDLPCLTPALIPITTAGVGDDMFSHIVLSDLVLVNRHFSKRNLKAHWWRWLFYSGSIKRTLYNIVLLMCFGKVEIPGFRHPHSVTPMLKSTLVELWKEEYDTLDKTCSHKFRCFSDVNQYIVSEWQLCSNNYSPISDKGHIHVSASTNAEKIFKQLNKQEVKVVCFNDDNDDIDFESAKRDLNHQLELKFPNKSSFEL